MNSYIAITEEKNDYTYDALKDMSGSFYDAIKKRTLIFIMSSNTVESVMAYISCIQNRVVPLLIEENTTSNMLVSMIDTYQPEFIWIRNSKCVGLDQYGYKEVFEYGQYVLLKSDQISTFNLNEDLALLISTSESTGSTKLVRQTYGNLKANTASIRKYLKICPDDVAITTLPMSYVYGLSIINTHLMSGAKIVLTDKSIYTGDFWTYFDEVGATSFNGVPYMFEMLDGLGFFETDHMSLKTITQAGGKLSVELQKKVLEFAKNNKSVFFIMYGTSEATARMSYMSSEMDFKEGSIGIPIDGGRFELIDTNGNVIREPRVAGELVYYGDNVTYGYACCKDDLALGDERKGRLETGDIACFDEDGYYYIVGRKSRFIKIHSKKIGLDEIEKKLIDKFNYPELACVGEDDRLIICTSKEGMDEIIKAFIKEEFNLNPACCLVVGGIAIPRNSSGKTRYSELRNSLNL